MLSKTKKITEEAPLQDEFPITRKEDEPMERVKAGKEHSKTFSNIDDLLTDLHS